MKYFIKVASFAAVALTSLASQLPASAQVPLPHPSIAKPFPQPPIVKPVPRPIPLPPGLTPLPQPPGPVCLSCPPLILPGNGVSVQPTTLPSRPTQLGGSLESANMLPLNNSIR